MALLSSSIGAIFLLIIGFTLYSTLCLLRNYLAARRLGIPIRIIPIDHLNPAWALASQRIVVLLRRLPAGLGDNNITRFNYMGFEIPLRAKAHKELGDVFALVSPDRIWVYVGEPSLVSTVFKRHSDFPHDSDLTAMLDVFGPNISTAQGPQWKKMRKLIASCFNDPAFELVWNESVVQGTDMARYWGDKSSVETIAEDTRTLSLNVMARAGFGKSVQFLGHHDRKDDQADETTMSYKEALQTILENGVVIMILGTKFLAKPWLPRWLRRLHYACTSFQGYMTDMFEQEKQASAEAKSSDRNLMTSLVRASQQEATSLGSLTEREIYGNLFVFNFAGHDTTAHTFVFALYFLAANPAVQNWIAEEIKQVLGLRPASEWDYKTDFPRLKRCLAVLLETLRIYSPVGMAKWTGSQEAILTIGENKSMVIPRRTMVVPSHVSVHSDPRFWGEDSLVWQPQRWITTESEGGVEKVVEMPRGSFMPWADGARDCPGRKFSQVEFVATIAALFRERRVEPLRREGETAEQAQRRTAKFIEEDTGMILLVQMVHPERCPLVWRTVAQGRLYT